MKAQQSTLYFDDIFDVFSEDTIAHIWTIGRADDQFYSKKPVPEQPASILSYVAGAGIGILSTKIVYWTYPYLQKTFSRKNHKYQTAFFPYYVNNGLILNVSETF